MVQAWSDIEETDWNLPVQDDLLFFLAFHFCFALFTWRYRQWQAGGYG